MMAHVMAVASGGIDIFVLRSKFMFKDLLSVPQGPDLIPVIEKTY